MGVALLGDSLSLSVCVLINEYVLESFVSEIFLSFLNLSFFINLTKTGI